MRHIVKINDNVEPYLIQESLMDVCFHSSSIIPLSQMICSADIYRDTRLLIEKYHIDIIGTLFERIVTPDPHYMFYECGISQMAELLLYLFDSDNRRLQQKENSQRKKNVLQK